MERFDVSETSIGPDFPEVLFDLPLVSIDVSVGVIERIPASISKPAPNASISFIVEDVGCA